MYRFLTAITLLSLSTVAAAQDDDLLGPDSDIFAPDDEEDDDFFDESKRDEPAEELDFEGEQENLDEIDETYEEGEEEIDLLGEDPTGPVSNSGDSAELYRQTQQKLAKGGAEEEIEEWERYLATYPNTPFRTRIEQRIEELMDKVYGGGIRDGGGPAIDAKDKEIKISQGLLLENINPRTRLQFQFEWGLPSYMNLKADYEHALNRQLSIHGGAMRRYTGPATEVGIRWAPIKSSRTQTIVSFTGDFQFNMQPAYPVIRPMAAVGKRFGDKLDVQAQVGMGLGLRTIEVGTDDAPDTRGYLDGRLIGGAQVFYRASEQVGMFAETGAYMRGAFAFNTVTFGMKFFPSYKTKDNTEVNVGASVPYMGNYWMYHFGAIDGQANIYL